MKILHTADWHLGIRFGDESMEKEQTLFLDWLINILNEKEIDILIVAGDIFDSVNPPNYAQKLYYDFALRFYELPRKPYAVIIGGNHDSPSMLNAPKNLLEALRFIVVGNATESLNDEIMEISTMAQEEAIIAAVPFLRDSALRTFVTGSTAQEIQTSIKNAIKEHYFKVATLCSEKSANRNIPIIATGHLYAIGSTISDSEKDIHIGTIGNVSSDTFSDIFDYVALGHIHKPQIVGDNFNIRYSGSPLKFSFSEINNKKSVVLLEFNGKQMKNLQLIPVPAHRELLRIKGTYEEISYILENTTLYNGYFIPFVEIMLVTDIYIPGVTKDLNEKAEGKFKIIKVLTDNKNQSNVLSHNENTISNITALKPLTLFEKLLDEKEISEQRDEYISAFNELLETCLQKELDNENT